MFQQGSDGGFATSCIIEVPTGHMWPGLYYRVMWTGRDIPSNSAVSENKSKGVIETFHLLHAKNMWRIKEVLMQEKNPNIWMFQEQMTWNKKELWKYSKSIQQVW